MEFCHEIHRKNPSQKARLLFAKFNLNSARIRLGDLKTGGGTEKKGEKRYPFEIDDELRQKDRFAYKYKHTNATCGAYTMLFVLRYVALPLPYTRLMHFCFGCVCVGMHWCWWSCRLRWWNKCRLLFSFVRSALPSFRFIKTDFLCLIFVCCDHLKSYVF